VFVFVLVCCVSVVVGVVCMCLYVAGGYICGIVHQLFGCLYDGPSICLEMELCCVHCWCVCNCVRISGVLHVIL